MDETNEEEEKPFFKKNAHHPSVVDRYNMHHQSHFNPTNINIRGRIYGFRANLPNRSINKRIREAVCDLLKSLNAI